MAKKSFEKVRELHESLTSDEIKAAEDEYRETRTTTNSKVAYLLRELSAFGHGQHMSNEERLYARRKIQSLSLPNGMSNVCPGNPSDSTYDAGVPLLGPAILSFIGTATLFDTQGEVKYISLQIWHYVGNNGDDSAEKHSMGTIWSRVPPTPRWSNTKLPRAGHLAQIQGAILGYYKGNLCVDMTNLSYLGPSPSTSKASPPSESQCTDSGPPRKRRLGAGT